MFQTMRLRVINTKMLPFFLVLLTLAGCVRGCGSQRSTLTPEKVVEGYLNMAMSMSSVSQRDALMEFTTGKLKDALASASEETIKKAYIERHYELESYAVIERRDRTPRETEITFRLKYKDLGTSAGGPQVTAAAAPTVLTENTVALLKEKGSWYIRDVVGAKTKLIFPEGGGSEIRATPGVITPPEAELEVEPEAEPKAPPATAPEAGKAQAPKP